MFTECPPAPPGPAPNHPVLPNPPLPQRTRVCWSLSDGELSKAAVSFCRTQYFWLPSQTPLYQSVLKEINPEYSLEGLMLKLKLQYSGHLTRRADSLGRTLILGKIDGLRRWVTEDEMVGWYHRLNVHESEQIPGDSEGQGRLMCCISRGRKELNMAESQQNARMWNLGKRY